ncbi:MAG: exosortase/archaeosortase family protein [Verrucomicrobia bacterium]|nr:exosortase/archaeosortase family protein [Verrucomicrobiota bacterium]
MSNQQNSGSEKPPAFTDELRQVLAQLPGQGWFVLLLLAWLALFHFLGNSTLGYVSTPSLFSWLDYCYEKREDDQLGYLIPFIVLALMWWNRREWAAVQKRVWWPALALVALGLVFHVLGFLVQQARISVVGFFVGLYGLTGVIWGPQWLRATFFPFVLFAFCLPLGNTAERITFPLRLLSTKISVAISHGALGINVIRQGTMLWEPTGKFQYEIAAACSGIRSLTAFLAFTIILGFVSLRSPWRRALVVATAFPLAVLSNVIRLLCIIIAAEAFGQQTGNWVHESAWFSLLPYVPSLIAVVVLSHWLAEKPAAPPEDGKSGGPLIGSSPLDAALAFPVSRRVWSVLITTVLLVGLTGGFLAHARSNQRLGKPGVKVVPVLMPGQEDGSNGATNAGGTFLAGSNSVFLPEQVLHYTSTNLPVARVVYEWLPKDTVYGQRLYRGTNGLQFLNNVVLMGGDRTSIHQPQYCLTGQGFQIMKTETDTLRITRPQPYDLTVVKLTAKGTVRGANGQPVLSHAVYVYWFVADNQLTADHAQRMWWMARDLVRTGVLQRWAFVAYLGLCPPGGEDLVYEQMKELIVAGVPEFQTTVGKAGK